MRAIAVSSVLLASLSSIGIAQTQPITLDGVPGRWTLNGQAVPDEGLGPRIVAVFEPRADKRLHFSTASSVPYGQAVEAMGTACAAGVEQLALSSPGGATTDAVVVDLVALPGLDTDLRLPVSE